MRLTAAFLRLDPKLLEVQTRLVIRFIVGVGGRGLYQVTADNQQPHLFSSSLVSTTPPLFRRRRPLGTSTVTMLLMVLVPVILLNPSP